LDNFYTFGPILIDQTPPLNKILPNVIVEKDQIVFGWDDYTFYDDEQTEQIDQIYFQIGTCCPLKDINYFYFPLMYVMMLQVFPFTKQCMFLFNKVYFTAHGASAVSPYLEWRLDDSPRCLTFTGGCFKYPLRRLQIQDTDNSILFHLNMHVYNNAGHYLSISTEPFKVPSLYPPGQSIVYDLDPEYPDSTPLADVDVHFKSSDLCASWTDATHHETVSYEVGVGLTNLTDDIIAFQHVKETTLFYFNSSVIQTDKTYFFLLLPNCSAGSTISSSDGVTVLDGEGLRNPLVVQPG